MQRQLALLLAALFAIWVMSLPSAGLAAFAGGFWPLRCTLILGSG